MIGAKHCTGNDLLPNYRCGNFDVKDALDAGRPIAKNIDKIMEIVESNHHLSTVSITEELNIAQKIVWYHINKAE